MGKSPRAIAARSSAGTVNNLGVLAIQGSKIMARWLRFRLILSILIISTILAIIFLVTFILHRVTLHGFDVLEYPENVDFYASMGQDYEIAKWNSLDWEKPVLCPISVSLPDVDLDSKHLGDFDRLKKGGWAEFRTGGDQIELYYRDRLVRCWFKDNILFHVEVILVASRGRHVEPLVIKYAGKQLTMPASEETIFKAYGPLYGNGRMRLYVRNMAHF